MYASVALSCHWEHFGCELPPECAIAAKDVKRLNKFPQFKGSLKNKHELYKEEAVRMVNDLYGLHLKFAAKDTTRKDSEDDIADAILVNRAMHLRLGTGDRFALPEADAEE